MQHLFLSPHLDDAVLSCGGTIATLVDAGDRVTVLTLFAGDAAPPYSAVAQHLHELWGNPRNVVMLRRAEDAAAVIKLGATPLYESAPDAIYRKDREGNWLYAKRREVVSVPPRPDDLWLPFYLAERARARIEAGSPRIYAPLGVGGHVDHLLTFEVAQLLERAGHDVSYYEDFPYVTNKTNYRKRIKELDGWDSVVVTFPEPVLLRKIDAFSYYRSQVFMLFEDMDVPSQFVAWGKGVSGSDDVAGERYWSPPAQRRRAAPA